MSERGRWVKNGLKVVTGLVLGTSVVVGLESRPSSCAFKTRFDGGAQPFAACKNVRGLIDVYTSDNPVRTLPNWVKEDSFMWSYDNRFYWVQDQGPYSCLWVMDLKTGGWEFVFGGYGG